MDDSFRLLISMSPKCNKNVKQTKRIKAPSRLALKKSIRRSSVYDKPPLENICIAEESSSQSSKSSSNNMIDDLQKKTEALNILSDTKVQSIKKWISDIPSEIVDETTDFNNVSIFSQVSAIHGELSKPKTDNGPINSTFINSDTRTCFKFDQLFKKKTDIEVHAVKKDNKHSDDVIEIIEDSDEENDKDNSFKTAIDNSDNASDKENNKNQNNIVFNTPKPIAEYDECESLLDEVYGKSWRKDKERILPQSEPRIHKPKKLYNEIPMTEIKSRKLYKNPYTDAEQKHTKTLLQKLREDRLKNTIQNSPWRQKFKDLCDSDTDSNSSVKRTLPKTKLSFDDDVQPKSTSKTNKNNIKFDKQTASDSFSDFSDSGLTLEEKLKGKAKAIPIEKPKSKITKKITKPRTFVSSNDSSDSDNHLVNEKDKRYVDKTKNTPRPRQLSISSESSEKSWSDFSSDSGDVADKPKGKSNDFHKSKQSQTGPASFLASLSKSVPDSRCDASARIFRNNYKTYKDQLLQKLFKLYNEKIFGNAISEDSPIEWSDRMTGTAGYCVCRKITHKNGKIERKVRFKLSTKILDSADRLRDTFVHELCHAATWLVNEVSDGHGPFWKSWACKAMRTFPELPAIKRCHDYTINTKYTYKCMGCGYSFGRHSKSLDLERKRCGHCYGKFEVLINKTTKNGETKSVPSVKKQPNGFALFVKENYSKYKTDNMKNKDVMKLLGQKFKDLKVDQKSK
ncbi:PREDICTED: acidic repeat-containing protein [Nicrophorus vespilloides]|uniref:Acidic repeat-containing protein n=1 Tax=Nicrophorus vespilloides TaxID=110193 RepID=A0ABM1MGW3_NICVS|nr:PREDICTED: acidic repeat-containing protein [Nicrophorus vespilloides]